MTLRSLELFHVAVPLRKAIKHASHERTTSDNLIVRAALSDGAVGFGEGVPREYVTGETIQTAFDTLKRFDAAQAIGSPKNFEEAVNRLKNLTLPEIEQDTRGMFGNAARCALELALLDAFGRSFGRSVADAVRILGEGEEILNDRSSPVRYSGAITAESVQKERVSAWKMKIYGFHQVKIKVGVTGQNDFERLKRLRAILGRNMDIRIDANEAWKIEELVDRVLPLLPFRPSALEQPVPHEEIDEIAPLRAKLGVPIMLDESLCGLPDARRAIERKTADIFNVRLSKCGGIVPSLAMIGLAKRAGLDVQLGCHPGETGLLSAAGRHVACQLKNLRYLEGSYDRHVLAENLTVEDPTFRYGGRAKPIEGHGLGVSVNRKALDAMTVAREEVDFGG